ncbi:hypothetical protein D3C71_704790 [compost metagenome]
MTERRSPAGEYSVSTISAGLVTFPAAGILLGRMVMTLGPSVNCFCSNALPAYIGRVNKADEPVSSVAVTSEIWPAFR